jgi:alginate O-acetyltransferase complex protein AlgI
MLFNSIDFLVFFPIVTILFFLLPHRFRWFLLLVSSCVFYMAFVPKYILILGVTIVVDYFLGLSLAKAKGNKILLTISIITNVGFLFVFKYFNFFNTNLTDLASFFHWNYPINNLSILLPIGLSFHTFQSMSYIIEVYRGNQKPERNFGIYALYVMFYPQLVAGPIERPQNLLNQFHEEKHFDYLRVVEGLRMMLWGMFKKVVIADNLALIVNSVYDKPAGFSGAALVIATYFFAFQIYCDFSGYTDIARGAAKVMGFNLMENFKRPYFSKSISEFWKRWHISLSSWFKDYVYIPLGGSRVKRLVNFRNIMIVFLLSGFWHGANWTYIIWGGLNGLYLIFSIVTSGLRAKVRSIFKLDRMPRVRKCVSIFITFNLISFSWIFFRAKSLSDALFIVKRICLDFISVPRFGYGEWKFDFLLGSLLIMFLLGAQLLQRKTKYSTALSDRPAMIRFGAYLAAIVTIILLGVTKSSSFIYFQF